MRRLDLLKKEALWLAFNGQCWLCGQQVRFNHMQIEHILPQDLANSPDRLMEIRQCFALPYDFDLASFANQRPAHRSCNRTKSASIAPILGFEVLRGMSQALEAERHFRRLSQSSDTDRALTILEEARNSGPLHPGDIERIRNLIHTDRRTMEWIDYPIPGPVGRTIAVGSAEWAQLVLHGQTSNLANFVGAILGVNLTTGFFAAMHLRNYAEYHACFRGLHRSFSEGGEDVLAYIQTPRHSYEWSGGHLKLHEAPPPRQAVLASYYRRDADDGAKLRLLGLEWTEADKTQSFLPADYENRFLTRLW